MIHDVYNGSFHQLRDSAAVRQIIQIRSLIIFTSYIFLYFAVVFFSLFRMCYLLCAIVSSSRILLCIYARHDYSAVMLWYTPIKIINWSKLEWMHLLTRIARTCMGIAYKYVCLICFSMRIVLRNHEFIKCMY